MLEMTARAEEWQHWNARRCFTRSFTTVFNAVIFLTTLLYE